MTISQKVITVNNSDTDINAELTAQNADGWVIAWMILSGTDVILLLTKTESAA